MREAITGMRCPRCRQQNRETSLPKSLNTSQNFPKIPMSNTCSTSLHPGTQRFRLGKPWAQHMRQHVVRALSAAPPVNLASETVRSTRRDDRGMMAPGCAGRGELMFPSFPAHHKPAPTSARRPSAHPVPSLLLRSEDCAENDGTTDKFAH